MSLNEAQWEQLRDAHTAARSRAPKRAGMVHLTSLVCALLITACPAATTPVLASHGVQYDSLSPSRLSFGRAVDIEDETLTEGSDPSARMESAVAGEAAILIIEFNPSMVLYRGE